VLFDYSFACRRCCCGLASTTTSTSTSTSTYISNINNNMATSTLRWQTIIPFFVFYAVFGLVLYPLRDRLHHPGGESREPLLKLATRHASVPVQKYMSGKRSAAFTSAESKVWQYL
jgi:TLC ATP/ADP transporter